MIVFFFTPNYGRWDQVIYATASAMFLIYYAYYDIWSIFVPCVMSFVFISYMIGIKIYLEEYLPRKKAKAEAREPLNSKLGSALLPEAEEHANNGDRAGGVSEVH